MVFNFRLLFLWLYIFLLLHIFFLVFMAELLKKYYPRMVDLHNYPPANSIANKLKNWQVLNTKVKYIQFNNYTIIGNKNVNNVLFQIVNPYLTVYLLSFFSTLTLHLNQLTKKVKVFKNYVIRMIFVMRYFIRG